MAGTELYFNQEPVSITFEEALAQMARERLVEFAQIKAKIGDVSVQIAELEAIHNPKS